MSDDPATRLPFSEHMRRRPGMYLGGLNDRGIRLLLVHLVEELLTGSNGPVGRVVLSIKGDQEIGISVSGTLAELSADSCFTDRQENNLDSELPIASAFCERLEFECVRDGSIERQVFSRGFPVTAHELRPTLAEPRARLQLQFDSQLFPAAFSIGFLSLCGGVQVKAIFHPRTVFVVEDQRTAASRTYQYARGLRSYLEEAEHYWFDAVRLLNIGRQSNRLYEMRLDRDGESAEAVILETPNQQIAFTFVNGARSPDHGTHLYGLERGYSEVLRLKRPVAWRRSRANVLEDLTVLIAVTVKEPDWAGCTKSKLENMSIEQLVFDMVTRQLPASMESES